MNRILIIDDEPQLRALMTRILSGAGYSTLEAATGEAGLAMAREHLPELTFCDVHMPGLDGHGVVQAFRDDPDLAHRQIVVITGLPVPTSQRTAMDLGADDYISKPFDAAELLRCVEARLSRAHIHWRLENRVLEELRSSLRSNLPHAFFTPLVGILGMSEVLMQEAKDLPREEIHELAECIHRSGSRLHRTLRNYLRLLELDRVEGPIPIKSTTTAAAAVVGKIAGRIAAEHDREPDLRLALREVRPRISEDDLALITEELIENAFGNSRRGTPVEVELMRRGEDSLLEIRDRGRGLTPGEARVLTRPGPPEGGGAAGPGMGLGLTLVTRLLLRAGGRLELDGRVAEGTMVRAQLPAEV